MNFKNLVAVAAMAFTATAFAAAVEGTDYVKLETPIPNAQGTVVKIYSYDCPFCYKYAKGVDAAVFKQVGDVAKFVPFHLKTKARYGLWGSKVFAVALAQDKAAGLAPLDAKSKFHAVEMGLYKCYHVKKMKWDAGEDAFLETALGFLGMSRADFDKACETPEVKATIEAWEVSYPIAKIQGVPAYVVNGKYLMYTKNISSLDKMVENIKELSAK
ncbi:MAG: thiol:disulfide interchange protein DsbA/DsbL [Duodenibacillus sp.]|nr:thiol:disulfide interchange protein DsbA/DsbL [Duodenibacillus sp.]